MCIQINCFKNDLGKFVGIASKFLGAPTLRVIFLDNIPVTRSDSCHPGAAASFDVAFRIADINASLGRHAGKIAGMQ